MKRTILLGVAAVGIIAGVTNQAQAGVSLRFAFPFPLPPLPVVVVQSPPRYAPPVVVTQVPSCERVVVAQPACGFEPRAVYYGRDGGYYRRDHERYERYEHNERYEHGGFHGYRR